MMIIMAIALVVVSVAIAMLLLKQGSTDAIIGKTEQEIDTKASTAEVESVKQRLNTQILDTDRQIKEITARLEEIAKDIKRLDERTEVDHKNLVDIRQRYILYKEPTVPVINGGVPWAKDIKCKEEDND